MNKLLIISLLAAVFILGCTTSQTNNVNQTNNTKDYNLNATENISENIIEESNKTLEIETCEKEQITNNTHKKTNLDIWGNKIIWEEQRGYNYYIFVYDMLTRKMREVPRYSYESSIAGLSIFDNEVMIWEDGT